MPFQTATPISVGDRFGRLVVIRELASVKSPNGTVNRMVECRCDCGTVGNFRLPSLRNGKTKSCGCLAIEVRRDRATVHGGTGTAEHKVWLGMKRRCADLSDENYGGRGIRVCQRWLEYAAFLEDMGQRPSPKHSIDRYPNQNGNYEPGNCRWATAKEQGRNTRANVIVEHDGESLCIAEWAERFGISPVMLGGRLEAGWEFSAAVSTPARTGDRGFYTTPIRNRDAAWYREYDRRENGL
jgi:hypothetical protein